MENILRKMAVTTAWAFAFYCGGVAVGAVLGTAWLYRQGNDPVNNPEFPKRVFPFVFFSPLITLMVGLILALMGKLPGTLNARCAK